MTLKKTDVTVDFDHHRPVTEVDPDEAYAELVATCPVSWSNAHGGYWVITGYDDVYHAFRDYRTFSSKDGLSIPPHPMSEGDDRNVPVDLDPPEHANYRRAFNPLLSTKAIEDLAPRIDHWTNHYIDRVIERGECDLIYDLALPIPAAITLEWVGWEAYDEWERIGEAWHNLIACPLDDPRAVRARADIGWFGERIKEEIVDRRANPRDDAITFIANLTIDGAPITEARAVGLVRIAVAGGVDTTQSLIGSALVHLHRHPEDRDRLLAQPELWERAVDEFLRAYPPVRTVARTVVDEVEVGGCLLEPGDRVLLVVSTANSDAGMFSSPEAVDLNRDASKHLSFGAGVHRCIGMHLARQEAVVVLRTILERMPDYRILEDRIEPYERQSEVAGFTSAPAVFTPRSARL